MTSKQPKTKKQVKPLTISERTQNASQLYRMAHPGQSCLTKSCCLIRTRISEETSEETSGSESSSKHPKAPQDFCKASGTLLTTPKDYLGQPFLHQMIELNSEGRGPQSTPTGEVHGLEARPSFGWENKDYEGQGRS